MDWQKYCEKYASKYWACDCCRYFLLVSLILGGTGFVPNFVNMGTGMFIHEVSILGVILNGMRLISYKNKKIN